MLWYIVKPISATILFKLAPGQRIIIIIIITSSITVLFKQAPGQRFILIISVIIVTIIITSSITILLKLEPGQRIAFKTNTPFALIVKNLLSRFQFCWMLAVSAD